MGYSSRKLSQELTPQTGALPQHILEAVQYYQSMSATNAARPEVYEDEENSLASYFQLLVKYRWLVGLVSAVIILLSLIYCILATPRYTGVASIKIGTYAPLLPQASVEDSLRQQTQETDYLNTQVNILSGLTLANRVLSESEISKELIEYLERDNFHLSIIEPFINLFHSKAKEENENTDEHYNYPVKLLQKYKALVEIAPVRRTSLVEISVTTENPEFSAKIANAHVTAFIELARSQRQRDTLDNQAFLKEQADELAGKVAQLEQNMSAYAEENAIVSLNENENIVTNRMGELNELLTQATARRIESESRFKEAEAGNANDSTAYDDETIQRLRVDLKAAEGEYALLGEKFKPEYPKMQQLQARINSLKGSLTKQRDEAIRGLKVKYESDKKIEDELNQQLEIQKSKAFELSRKQVHYNIMKREYSSLRDLHQAVLIQLKEAQVSAQSTGSNISIADYAAVPQKASFPKRLNIMLLAMFFGPLFGVGLALGIEALDNTIRTPEQAEKIFAAPTLGVVPMFSLGYENGRLRKGSYFDPSANLLGDQSLSATQKTGTKDLTVVNSGEKSENANQSLVTISSPWSLASEAFRAIRTSILLSSADNPPKVIMVTSAQKAEGKTTLISNLAITLAQSSYRTLLIDADLRRPSVYKSFNMDKSSNGLVEYLTGIKDLGEVVCSTSVEKLFVMTSGAIPPNPSELLGSAKMDALLEKLAQEYDYILVDAPPVLPVTDAVSLSPFVDGVVVVVRGHETTSQVVTRAMAKLRQVKSRILGIVLNDVDLRRGDYYYYRREHYGYYAEDSKNV